jgi:hypothetical protein
MGVLRFSVGIRFGLLIVGLLLLAACGGGNDADPPAPSTYSVGGTVSGLNGSLTLANNGGDARTVNANGAFNFATKLAGGVNYNVTITTQPATQTCTVTGATGSVAAANVSAVAINCVTNLVTIGGTVSGLVGTGLVLQNNGGDDISVAANGAFTFATPIDAGTNYSLTVLSAPPAQLCTAGASVGGPSGTAMGNVTNLVVDCQMRTFTVGGTFVANSASFSVVLQLNGANNQRTFGPGPFTLVAGVQSGSPYEVTIWSQTSPSGLACFITNGSGVMGVAAVTNVIVTCPAPPTFDSVPGGTTVQAPARATYSVVVKGTPVPTLQWQVSTDAGATWNDIPGATETTYLTPATTVADDGKRFRVVATNDVSTVNSPAASLAVTAAGPAKAWSTPVRISDELGQAATPQIAASRDGSVVAVWQQFDPNNFRYDIWAARYGVATATGWTAPMILDTETGNAQSPRVVIDTQGNALVVWTQNDGVRNNVWSRRYASGSGWGTAALIESDDVDVDPSSVRLVMDAFNRGLAMWKSREESPSSRHHLRTAAFNGSWLPDTTAITSEYGIESLDMVSNRDGDVRVVFSQFAAGPELVADIVAAGCSIDSGDCVVVKELESDTTGGWDIDVHLANNASGTSFAVWRRYDVATSTFRLRTSRTNSGGVWSNTPEYVDTLSTSVDALPAVAVDSIGNAIVVWAQKVNQPPNERTTIYSSRFSTTSGWGGAVRLESQNRADDIFPSQRPQIAFGASFNAISVWQSGIGLITGGIYSSGAWEIDRDIGNGSSGVSRDPQITFENSGTGIAIFVQETGGSSMPSVFVSRYE